MKKNGCRVPFRIPTSIIKCLLMIKLIVFLICFLSLQAFATNGLAQERVSLNLENASLKKAFKAIENQTRFRFVYIDDELPQGKKINIKAEEEPLSVVLEQMLEETSLSFKLLSSNLIVISPKSVVEGL